MKMGQYGKEKWSSKKIRGGSGPASSCIVALRKMTEDEINGRQKRKTYCYYLDTKTNTLVSCSTPEHTGSAVVSWGLELELGALDA
jgi:hypothetical protein